MATMDSVAKKADKLFNKNNALHEKIESVMALLGKTN